MQNMIRLSKIRSGIWMILRSLLPMITIEKKLLNHLYPNLHQINNGLTNNMIHGKTNSKLQEKKTFDKK